MNYPRKCAILPNPTMNHNTMEFKIKRTYKGEHYTIGKFYVNGIYWCDTLELKVRELAKQSDKIPGDTAIPSGRYKFMLTWSNRFGRKLPEIKDVPFFDGIRMHRGNWPKDTLGCPLCGENKVKGGLVNSIYWEERIVDLLQREWDNGNKLHYITVE